MRSSLLDIRADEWTEVVARRYREVRRFTEQLCAPLEPEDYVVQSMPDASPVKWHLAHSSWFFETFVLARFLPGYEPFHPQFSFLFNSYYNAVGPRWPRSQRGALSRPTVDEVFHYRRVIDRQMEKLFEHDLGMNARQCVSAVVLGLHHEQQHQELILTDVKHAFASNPLYPAFAEVCPPPGDQPALEWVSFPEGLHGVGHDRTGFAYDNEGPRHRTFLHAYRLASRPVTNDEYMRFINDNGYQRSEFWLNDGWLERTEQNWSAPLYWEKQDGEWWHMTLGGLRPAEGSEPVCHVSYYEADAYARWAGARLPTEQEWEGGAASSLVAGHFAEAGWFHPAAAPTEEDTGPLHQLFGDVWQWTASSYRAYPGYRPPEGAMGEYNGKFMANQMVIRGASCATPRSHARHTYRNYYYPDSRWQFTGIRLAADG